MENVIKTGETVSEGGVYYCTNCGQQIELKAGDTVPPCPKCTNNGFTKTDQHENRF